MKRLVLVPALQNLQALAGDLRGETGIQRYHYLHVHVVTSYSLRVWAFRDGRRQLANTQQTVIADAPPALGAG